MKRLVLAGTALMAVASCAGKGDNTEVAAKVNGTSITVKDIQQEMSLRPDVASAFVREPGGTERFVDSIARKEMLYLEAKKQGIDKDDEIKRVVKDFEKITVINKLLEKELSASGNITDKEIQEYYEKNSREFMIPTKVRISLILVKTPEEAIQAGERLKKGEDFGQIAKDLSSERKSAEKGGDIGYVKKGMLPVELENIALYKMKLDNVAGPIQTQDGIYFMKATDVQGEILGLDKVKTAVESRLKTEKQKAAYEKFTSGLGKAYKVEINKAVAAKITLPAPKFPAEAQKPAEHAAPAAPAKK
ncbi:MAG: peptidyl-prolyl cis-trans isomerase [Thermodesulfovibrionales bacterium]